MDSCLGHHFLKGRMKGINVLYTASFSLLVKALAISYDFYADGHYILVTSCCSFLKGLFHPACLARVVSCLAIVVIILLDHESGNNKGQPRGCTCK